MNEIGIAVDTSHCCEWNFYDIARTSTKPIIASHSNVKALYNHYRNLSDLQLDIIKNKDGLVGGIPVRWFVKTKKENAAFLFASYIASEFGQSIQADEGFAIPLQKSVANSDVYLKPDQKPANIKVFIDACYYETPGDWWYLRDKKWIDDWASLLNGDVRNGKITLSDFYASQKFTKTQGILNEYTKKK